MESIFTVEALLALFTLTVMEIILGIDNIIFISIVTDRLPVSKQKESRIVGLSIAIIMRTLLLLIISWLIHLTKPLFIIFSTEISIKDLILLAGGIFLISKSTLEIHSKFDEHEHAQVKKKTASEFGVIIQIVALDLVFSFDSILTAVGLSRDIPIMIAAIVVSMILMMVYSGVVADFVNKRPTIQMLALSFLILIGFMLVLESVHYEVPRGYIYFAMFFAMAVEMLNIRLRKKKE